MKIQRIFLIMVFIMFLVGITCVSAESIDDIGDLSTDDADNVISADDLDDNEDLSTDDADDSLDDGSSLDEKDVLPSRGPTTVTTWAGLGSAVSNNNYDPIYIGANIAPGSQIVINHNVTIIGSANTYIGGSSSSNPVSYSNIPIYSNTNGISITLKDIKFQNCGGNILMKFSGNGHYVLDNCTFENVTATGDHQSVVHLNLGNCDIINCTFEKCTTSYGTVSNYNENSVTNVHMTVRDSTFKNNHATVEPGCINNCGQLEVYDSTFEGNSATWWAGAIHTHTNANTTVVRSIFRNNIAGWNGGALYTYSYLTVIDSIFIGNEAHQTSGGAIAGSGYGSRPYLTVLNCEFKNNNASGSGGAISFGSGELIVNNSVFDNNKALSGTGGAISTSGATSTITYSNFTNNSATGRGGAIYATGNGQLNVYHCNFVNDSGSEGQDIAYHYTTKKTNKAFLNYDYDEFWGANNASGSIYAYNTQYLTVNAGSHNGFHDISQYVPPSGGNSSNNTNGTTGDIVVPDSFDGIQLWNASLDGALEGTPVISGNYILIPAGHTLYCYYLNGTYVWNVTSEWGYFKELLVDGNVIYAPCSWDKLYILNLATGNSLTNANIYQGSSLYAPVLYNGAVYICSEYGYGANSNLWITMVKLVNGDYVYYNSILELNNVAYGSQAMLSKPIIYGNCLYVNTVNGLVRYNLLTNTMTSIADTIGNPVIDSNGNICVLRNISGSTYLCLLDSSLNVVDSELLGGNCNKLVSDGAGSVYTVDTDGYIHYASYTSAGIISCEVTGFNINPVSSAITCSGNYLYIGDDAGILWVFNINLLDSPLEDCLSWAFNATSPIVGNILVDNLGNVYVGNDNGDFYAVNSA